MKKQLTTITAVFVYFVLYAPQPLLPTFAKTYSISVSQAGALMTATLIPLALAPLFYGYLLSLVSPSRLIKYAVCCMGISCLAFAWSESYQEAFAVRFLQGLLLPAALTAITTHIGTHSRGDELQKNMSLFVTGTILGGLFGRILAGLFATVWSWQAFYYGLATMLFIIATSIPKEAGEAKAQYAPLKLNRIANALAIKAVLTVYLAVFCLFFSFVAVLNYLPFILETLLDNPDELVLGLMYCGFVMGAVSSLNAHRLIARLGSTKRVMLAGYSLFLLAIILLFIPLASVIFVVLFLFCGAMFLVHSVAVAEVNQRSSSNKSILNALYVTAYYSGGVLGSYLPGLVFEHCGHAALLGSLLLVSGAGFVALWRL